MGMAGRKLDTHCPYPLRAPPNQEQMGQPALVWNKITAPSAPSSALEHMG